MNLDPLVVSKLHDWLGKNGRHFFRTLAKLYKGDVIPVIRAKGIIPCHCIHFREGMQIRNYFRGLEECKEWTFDQFENDYPEYIKAAMVETN
jgi:hypothetical protein